MTLEERMKAFILTKYKSLRDFINNSNIDMPYTTLDGMLKRGIFNASISNVITLCSVLDINIDELAKGNIVPTGNDPVQEYARKLSELDPETQKTVFQYIDFLITQKGESK